jgi:transcriptional regulator with XRE-family HTH domain
LGDFARTLRRLREARGWTKYRLAQESGVTKENLSKLERPGSDPKLSTLSKLAAALGVSARELVPEAPRRKARNKGRAGGYAHAAGAGHR